jgi:predicted membrane-bound spermidine synthase
LKLRERIILLVALIIFFTSGFAALLYQVLWQRMLGLFSGTDVFSVTIIVAAYMAGMGVGSLTGGYLADRLSRWGNLALFAAVEFSIALFALGSKTLYYDWLYLQNAHLAASPVLMALTLFLSLLIPTFCMGVSLPALARALTREIQAAAGTIGALYAVNTLGAAIGAFATTWIFLRQFSFENILWIGAALNFSVALAAAPLAWSLARTRAVAIAETPRGAEHPAAPVLETLGNPGVTFWILLYGVSGFIALSLEILWFRLLGVMLKSTAFTFGTLLTIYLLGLAVGTFVGIALVQRSQRPMRAFLLLQSSIAIYAMAILALLVAQVDQASELFPLWVHFADSEPLDVALAIRTLPLLWSNTAAIEPLALEVTNKFLLLYVALPLALLGLPTLCMGMSFPFLQKIVQTNAAYLGRRVGWLQTSNIVGSMLGTVLTGAVALSVLGTLGTLHVLTAMAGLFLFLAARVQFATARARRAAYIVIALGLVALNLVVPDAQTVWAKLHGTKPNYIIFAEDSTGLAVLKSKRTDFVGGTLVLTNGLGQSWIPYGQIHSVLGFLPALIHPAPKEIAIIGLGSGDTLFHVGGRPETTEIVCIEIVGTQLNTLYEMAQRQRYPALYSILTDARIKYVITDGRSYIMQSGRKFDIIEADALRPSSAYSGNLYSEEYFTLLLKHLKPGGLAVTWVPTPRVHATFTKIFPYYANFDDILIGSNQPIVLDRAAIYQRLEHPFTREYYQRSFVNIHEALEEYLVKRQPLAYGPTHPRTATDTNLDLFPRDEYLIPFRSP